jgi:aminoglycoside phosphotransferase
MAAPYAKEDSQKWLSHQKPQGCADSALRYRYCDAKRKCGKLVAALRHCVNVPKANCIRV